MSLDLLRPPSTLSPTESLHRSQQAPHILSSTTSSLPWPLTYLTQTDSPEKWTIHENLFHSCLRTGDNRAALLCLDRLKDRFGENNERVMGLTGLYVEATASSQERLENILEQYKEAIGEKPTNFVLRKRHITLLLSAGKTEEAVSALNELLDASPTDAEAWTELAGIYFSKGWYGQTVFCLEECLCVVPNAWNMHAMLGEALYVSANASNVDSLKNLIRSLKYFCRSIELCDDYLRGFYGLKLVTDKLKEKLGGVNEKAMSKEMLDEEGYDVPSASKVEKLNELATSKVAEIVRRYSTGETGWTGYEESEVIAARELLDRTSGKTSR